MRDGDFHHIDLFDEYMAMRLSRKKLKYMLDTHYPHIDLVTELADYQQALNCLQMGALRQSVEKIHSQETKAYSTEATAISRNL